MIEIVTRYDGTCPTCGRTHALTLESEQYALIPPPTIRLACQCRIPVTEFIAVYVGSVRKAQNPSFSPPERDDAR